VGMCKVDVGMCYEHDRFLRLSLSLSLSPRVHAVLPNVAALY
jgi:hypothetical protein